MFGTCVLLMLAACSTVEDSMPNAVIQSSSETVDRIVAQFSSAYAAAGLPETDLSFIRNITQLGSAEALTSQQKTFNELQRQLASVDTTTLDICRQIDVSMMTAEAMFIVRRAQLGLRYLPEAADISAATRLLDIPLGQQWYAFYLDRWNGARVDPDEIYAFGEDELTKSVSRYDALVRNMGFAGDTDGLQAHLLSSSSFVDGPPAQQLLQERQARVWSKLSGLFHSTYDVAPAAIVQSDRGVGFPVPGYYLPDEKTFYYNALSDQGFEARQADWLFLHEGTPGHHFQITAARSNIRCESRLPQLRLAAYVEGWAAYVETLGAQLGLYEQPAAELAAIEWNMVRSVRVVLDVAINAYGWSDERALQYWHDHVRGLRDIAGREIARIKRWPGQVVTYKYGADVFSRTRARIAGDSLPYSKAIRDFHDAAIAYGAMPLATFEALAPALVEHASSIRQTADR